MTHPTRSLVGLGSMLVLLVGCDGAGGIVDPDPGRPLSVISEADGIRLTLQTDKTGYELGESVAMSFEVKNVSDERRTFDFSSACQHDVEVSADDGLVWSISYHVGCAQVLTSFDLGPGETWTRSEVWDQRTNKGESAGAGSYDVKAALLQMTEPLESDSLKIVIR